MDGWDTEDRKVTEIARMPARGYSGLAGFGLDAAGELYMCQLGAKNGAIFKMVAEAPPDGAALPTRLSQTGAFSDTPKLTPASGLVAYGVNVPFWSDGAIKRRWVALPDGHQIGFSPTDAFTFPAGTVFVKHFDLALDETRPKQSTRRLETRVLMRGNSGGIYGATYRWRPDGRDADRLDDAATEEITVATADPIGDLHQQNIGTAPPAEFHVDPDQRGCKITSTASTGVAEASDSLSFASIETTGDFDVRVRIESLDVHDKDAMAGLTFRQTDNPGSPMFGVLVRQRDTEGAPTKPQIELVQRQAADTPLRRIARRTVSAPPRDVWLRLQRRDQWSFSAFSSSDGTNWKPLSDPISAYYRLSGRVGLATAGECTTVFGDLTKLRRQTWYYPSSFDCLSCHNQTAGMVLGVNARQLNRTVVDPATGESENQLLTWWRLGMFSADTKQAEITSSPRLTPIDDVHALLQDRARSYLDVNCAYCHGGGTAGGYFDARFTTPFEKQNLLTDQMRNTMGLPNARIIAACEPNRSILLLRIHTVAASQKMPPLGRNRVDEPGAQLIDQWISEMKPQ
jgi:hypothetical protein